MPGGGTREGVTVSLARYPGPEVGALGHIWINSGGAAYVCRTRRNTDPSKAAIDRESSREKGSQQMGMVICGVVAVHWGKVSGRSQSWGTVRLAAWNGTPGKPSWVGRRKRRMGNLWSARNLSK